MISLFSLFSFDCYYPISRVGLVVVVATITSNCSILLARLFWPFSLYVFYRSFAEHPHENIHWACLWKPACLHIQQPAAVVFTLYLGRLASGCYVLPKGNLSFYPALLIRYIFRKPPYFKPIPLSATWEHDGWMVSFIIGMKINIFWTKISNFAGTKPQILKL